MAGSLSSKNHSHKAEYQNHSLHTQCYCVCPVFIDFCTVKIAISTTKPSLMVNFRHLMTSQIDHWRPYWIIKINCF